MCLEENFTIMFDLLDYIPESQKDNMDFSVESSLCSSMFLLPVDDFSLFNMIMKKSDEEAVRFDNKTAELPKVSTQALIYHLVCFVKQAFSLVDLPGYLTLARVLALLIFGKRSETKAIGQLPSYKHREKPWSVPSKIDCRSCWGRRN